MFDSNGICEPIKNAMKVLFENMYSPVFFCALIQIKSTLTSAEEDKGVILTEAFADVDVFKTLTSFEM